MKARTQWAQGLQWGACLWLCYVVARMLIEAAWPGWRPLPEQWTPADLHFNTGLRGGAWPMAAAWIVVLVLVARGSRHARRGLACAIAGQGIAAVAEGWGYPQYAPGMLYRVAFVMLLFVPMCVPLLPLLVLDAKEPRIVLAMLSVGRWREARARLAASGAGALAVAGALVSLHWGTRDLLYSVHGGATPDGMAWGLYISLRLFEVWTLPMATFALAVVAVWATARRCFAPEPWAQGLQWGACLWLCYVVARMLVEAAWPGLRPLPDGWEPVYLHCETGWPGVSWPMAAAWVGVLILVARGSRHARLGLACAITGQGIAALAEAWNYPLYTPGVLHRVAFVVVIFVPMCVPLLPLLVLDAKEPRLVLAMLSVGRWREARARLAASGAGVLAVTGALVSLYWGAHDVLYAVYCHATVYSKVRGLYVSLRYFPMWTLPMLTFAMAAVAVWTTARRGSASEP